MSQPGPQIPVIVLVDQERFGAALGALVAAGALVDQENREIGTISCRVRVDQLDGISATDGVLAVERTRTFQLPSADAEVQ